MSLCLFIGTASAQTVVTDLNQLSNDKKYFIKSKRCFLTCSDEYSVQNKLCTNTGTGVGSITEDYANDKKQQFKIVSNNGKYYLYSVYKEMYIKKDSRSISDGDITTKFGVFTSTMDEALSFEQISGEGEFCWKLKLGNYYMNSQEARQTATGIIIDSWSTTDDGNSYKIIEITEEPLVENGKLYRIKNRCMNLGLSQQNAGDGNGAYLGSTYYTLQHYNQNIREIHCATTSKADAGCIWMFEGSDSDGWAIKNMNNGMYIDDQRGDAALEENAHLYVKFVEGIENAARFTIEEKGTYVTFYDDDFKESNGNYLHAFAAGLQVWSANDSDAASHWTIEPATELEVNLNAYTNNDDREGKNNGYYASLYLPFDVTFDPSVISVNTVTVQGTSAILESQNDITTLPANSGVIVKGDGNGDEYTPYTFGIPGTVSESLSNTNNQLSGTNVDLALDGSNSTKYFVLGKDANGVLGLRTPSSSVAKIPANRAYLPAPTGGSVNALRFDLGETTAIENVVTEKENAPIYDLTGRRVLNTVKGGIYIQNGKKFIVK